MVRLGQHFLRDARILHRIVEVLAPKEGEVIVEIGPGRGALTRELASHPKVHIIAIEKDPRLAASLAHEMKTSKHVNILEGDVRTELEKIVRPLGEYKLAGNIPYYLTGYLLRLVGELENKPARTVLMVQSEVAERIVAVPPRMNRLAASVGFWANPKIALRVPKSAFAPPPRIDSAVIVLEPISAAGDPGRYFRTVRALFAQPRKTIGNNVRTRYGENGVIACTNAGVDVGKRPQDLSMEQISRIAGVLE